MLDWFDKLCNNVNDWDLTWVGFRALRPARDQDMTTRVVAIFCVVYCPLSAVVAYLITRLTLARSPAAPAALPWIVAAAAAAGFVGLQSLFAYFWNRRARRLRANRNRQPIAS